MKTKRKAPSDTGTRRRAANPEPRRPTGSGSDGATAIPGLRYAHIGELVPDPENANSHPERSIAEISRSLESLGAGRSILIDGQGLVVAGNGVLESASQAGFERVLIVPTDGHTLVAVQRADLTPAQAAEMGVRDNRSAQFAVMQLDRLVAAAERSTKSLEELGYRESEFKALQKLAEGAARGAEEEADAGDQIQQYAVVLACHDEDDQARLLEEVRAQFPDRDVKAVSA